ncbi:MAG: TIGR01777 family oxidoreductase [Gammaproteobacteria bacterium]|nr:TIGR01777 family oxidoreductase [Gammaproteobacteria bacterium]
MNILLTGGTGLIGRALCRALLERGCEITVLSRRPATVGERCGAVRAIHSLDQWRPGDRYDAVINLAGAPIVGGRWSARRKRTLWDSRVALTEALVEKIAAAGTRPGALLSGSAVGFYGDSGDLEVTESAPAGDDFGARLCDAWEQAARRAEDLGVRVCLLRTGLVLSRAGGMLARMLPPFRLGLGARLGDGSQWMSWIHIDDQVAMMVKLLFEDAHHGAYNLCAPEPVRNADFTARLAAAVHRPAVLFAPAPVIHAALGEAACLLLGGQRAAPARMTAADYRFRHAALDGALQQLL